MSTDASATNWELKLLYDGACPLCRREAANLERMDRGRGRLLLEDISTPTFNAERYGLTQAAVDARIHAVLPDGSTIEGPEVFRRAYAAVGWGWLLGWTNWAPFRPLVNLAYNWFARNRHRLTGRTAPNCESGACEVDYRDDAPNTRGSASATSRAK